MGKVGARARHPLVRGIEQELTQHLERASDLSMRAKRANGAAQHEIDRAMEIVDELRGVSSEADQLRLRRRGR